jgi:hypothetical protein
MSLALSGRKQATAREDFEFHISYLLSQLQKYQCYLYLTRLASNEIFSPSNKIHREIGWTKDLSAPLYR